MATRVSLRSGNWSDQTSTGPWGDSGTANAAVTTTTGPPGTLTDTRKAWGTNQLAGATVTCNGKTLTVASNTGTVITGTGAWSGGGNPGNGFAYTVGGASANAAPCPQQGDDVTIAASMTVTIDDTANATIDIGSDTGTALTCSGKLRVGASNANANDPTIDHVLRLRGHFTIANAGEFNVGQDLTSGRIPSTRKFAVELNYSTAPARNKYQLNWNGTLNVAGYNRDAQDCRDLLASTAASAQKNIVLLAAIPSSWAVNDQLVISSTDTTSTHHEVRKFASAASATVTVDTNLTYQHLGAATEPLRGELINVERNVIFRAGNAYGGTANAAVTTATGPPGTLTDTRATWTTNQFAGLTVTCNGKTLTVASNTGTVITGTGAWSGGGNPGNGFAYTIDPASPDINFTTANGWLLVPATSSSGSIQWARFQDLTYNANDAWCDWVSVTASAGTFGSCVFLNVDRGLFRARAAGGQGLVAQNCSVFNVGGNSVDCIIVSTTSATGVPYDFGGTWIVGCQSATTSKGINFLNHRYTKIAGSRISGMYTGFLVNVTSGTAAIPTTAGLWDSLSCHSNRNDGIDIGSVYSLTQYDVTGWWVWANLSNGMGSGATGGTALVAAAACTITDLQSCNNGAGPFYAGYAWSNVRLINPVINNNGTGGWSIADNTQGLTVINLAASGNTTSDVTVGAGATVDVDLINPNVGVYGTITSSVAYRPAQIRCQRDGATTHYKILSNIGQINEETTSRHTASGYAWKFTPVTFAGGARLRSPIMRFAVAASAPITITVWTAKDAAYNGAQQTLRLFGGVVQGIASDVTATATIAAGSSHTPPLAGDWEQLSVNATPTEDGVVEVVFECDGSAGNVYWDDVGFTQ